ncbi:MAG: RNA 2',3'-cyclic phosphodiesterase [Clostridia bacterium]|nr:RNA 2',3'-cyclic phosphodiesterase [Clostridia bacterium]MBR6186088.1 RNA 2',3'-cyclic phosphodiesterase [Clostridia bacterium]
MMRIFVALQPAPAFRDALATLQDRLRAAGVAGRYLTPANLHLTLAFIGMWPEDMTGLLPSVQQPFSITLSHLGIFPAAKVLWAGMEPSDALNGLALQVRHALTEAEIPFDRREFNPHITLVRKPIVPENLILSDICIPQAAMTVKDVCLYRSEHCENGMEYTVIGRGKRPVL